MRHIPPAHHCNIRLRQARIEELAVQRPPKFELRNLCAVCYLGSPNWQGITSGPRFIFSGFDPNPVRNCSNCGKKPAQVTSMLNSLTGRTVRIFKCECGEQLGPRISEAAAVGGLSVAIGLFFRFRLPICLAW